MRRIVCTLLILLLALPTAAYATGMTSQRQEDLDFLYDTLRQNHPDLFANTSEENFLAKKAEIEAILPTADDFIFELELMSLAALAGDSHTSLGLQANDYSIYPVGIKRFGGDWVLSTVPSGNAAFLGWKISLVNGLTTSQVAERLSPYFSSDNETRLLRQVIQAFGIAELFAHAGVTEAGGPLNLDIVGSEGQTERISLAALPANDQSQWPQLSRLQPEAQPLTASQKQYYFSLDLSDDAYYIQYNACAQDPNLAMEDFAAQVGLDLEKGGYKKVIIDFRNNGGGSDGVLVPVLMLLSPMIRSQQLDVYAMIGEATFSSAVINAMEIREMGGYLVGEPSGGSVDHFGSVNTFQLPNSGLRGQYSTKYISLADYFECAVGLGVTSIQPDLTVSQSLEDYLAGRDTAIEAVLALQSPPSNAPDPDAPLSRGRFTAMLRQSSGDQADTWDSPFSDLFPFNWYTPDAVWAKEQGIIKGVGGNSFNPAGTIKWQEAALMVQRYLQSSGKSLPDIRTSLPQQPADPWASEAVDDAWRQGLLPAGVDPKSDMNITQGQLLSDFLAQALTR